MKTIEDGSVDVHAYLYVPTQTSVGIPKWFSTVIRLTAHWSCV